MNPKIFIVAGTTLLGAFALNAAPTQAAPVASGAIPAMDSAITYVQMSDRGKMRSKKMTKRQMMMRKKSMMRSKKMTRSRKMM